MIEQVATYTELLEDLKTRVQQARSRAALAVNRELIVLYWQIGRRILEVQGMSGWGSKVVPALAKDLKSAFPDMKGFSRRNLLYMRLFAEAYPESEFVQQLVAQLPWDHNVRILDKLKTSELREQYAKAAFEFGWSRSILEMQIESQWHARTGQAITNFSRTLPPPTSDLAQLMLKDPYNFDFLGLHDDALEREIEKGLLTHLKNFLLELGAGFAFIGNQYHLEVGGQDYYIDLLFYHVKLHCYVVIELKAREFMPEDAGKLGFYLAAVDGELSTAGDNPTIGLLLCKTKNAVTAEYALKNINAPLGVSDYQLTESLPKELQTALPSIEELEAQLGTLDEDIA
jgi:predicted nuclease of restriction endonuclease-like (RecB) superfamily